MARRSGPVDASPWRIGARFGLIGAALTLINTIAGVAGALDPISVINVSYGLVALGLALDAASGWLTTRHGASVSAAALAGLVAGGLSALIWSLSNIAFSLALPVVTTQHFNVAMRITVEPVGPGALVVIFILAGLIAFALSAALGAGAGALGGLVGRRREHATARAAS